LFGKVVPDVNLNKPKKKKEPKWQTQQHNQK
jgi:hypothetical protein